MEATGQRHKRLRTIVLVAVILIFALVFADTLGVFDNRPYREISHGNHVHYVPLDWDGSVSASQFPTRPPADNEMITPDGRIVPKPQ